MESRAVGRHDAADFDDVFRDHYEAMVRSLAVACGDREVAADAVQDGSRGPTPAGDASADMTTLQGGSAASPSTGSATTSGTRRGRKVTERLAGRATVEPGPAPGGPTDELIRARRIAPAAAAHRDLALLHRAALGARGRGGHGSLRGCREVPPARGARSPARTIGNAVTDDFGFEPLDDELGRRLRDAAPPAGDAGVALDSLRPSLRTRSAATARSGRRWNRAGRDRRDRAHGRGRRSGIGHRRPHTAGDATAHHDDGFRRSPRRRQRCRVGPVPAQRPPPATTTAGTAVRGDPGQETQGRDPAARDLAARDPALLATAGRPPNLATPSSVSSPEPAHRGSNPPSSRRTTC